MSQRCSTAVRLLIAVVVALIALPTVAAQASLGPGASKASAAPSAANRYCTIDLDNPSHQ